MALMFKVREWYKQYGLQVENWRLRPDDHLVCQLQFIAHLLSLDNDGDKLREIAQFLDEHLLLWIRDFALTLKHQKHQIRGWLCLRGKLPGVIKHLSPLSKNESKYF